MRRVLILGGTAEARRLAERLADRTDLVVALSLAGRTAAPARQPVQVRIGGFGGVDGLRDYLSAERIDVLVDATHPYAAQISAHAVRASAEIGVPLITLHRPAWTPVAGDRWIEVVDTTEAARVLGDESRRVFLALGRQELGAFVQAPQHEYLIRTIEPVYPPLTVPRATYILGRGPYAEADEHSLLVEHAIEVVVAKNSGGMATYGKIAAARVLGIPVIFLRRPLLPTAPSVETVEEAAMRLDHALALRTDRGV
jgi:precorrin-6A/cobalt-precorrin-6A reductase